MLRSGAYKKTVEDYVINSFIYLVVIVVFFITIYPFYYALIVSFNEGMDASRGGIFIWPRKMTLENYEHVFSNKQLLQGFKISTLRTVLGTIISVLFTGAFAYGLSHYELKFRRTYANIMIFAMYFSGGLIPFFILLRRIGLMDTFGVYIIPSMLTPFNAIIMMSFFREISPSLRESARIDGANDLTIFAKIIIPVSMPVFATIALFNGVGHWNNWFDAAYFVTRKELKTVAFWLMELINQANITAISGSTQETQHAGTQAAQQFTAESIRMATMIVVVIPIICVYPFLQKYFVKGIMIGSIKG